MVIGRENGHSVLSDIILKEWCVESPYETISRLELFILCQKLCKHEL